MADGVGHATALHHARLHAELRRHVVELRAAAVHEHDADAEVVQDRHLLDEGAHRRRRRGTRRRPVLMTKTLPLYMWMYGAAPRSARTVTACSPLCPIIVSSP